MSNVPHIRSFQYWKNKFNMENIDYTSWISVNITNHMLPRKCKDFNWKLLHGLINTETKLKAMKFSNGICKVCKSGTEENLEHLLYSCTNSRIIFNNIEQIINTWAGIHIHMNNIYSLSGIWQTNIVKDKHILLIINVILSITRFHIWKIRCCIKYDDKNIELIENVNKLKWSLIDHTKLLISNKKIDRDIMMMLESLRQIINDHRFRLA